MCKDQGGKKRFNDVIIKVRDLPEGSRGKRDLDEVVGVSSGQKTVKINPKGMRKVIVRARR